ncbi:hypothetical protein BDP27DRAFT_1368570 [Rhodocollybia butyracea]|uniref:Uncharacterized protein n=1 Tax=Rhodocollybia butyracea TaxID=206335 RepID=A0A9P5U1T3_9AGAR|nr:hypothetical protein BDP27DRAFT_1368570 [Rhodocollybia butyracea]
MTVTFIDMNGGPHQDVPKEIEPFLTAQITLALDVSGSITYSGPYSLKSRYFFKLVGGHPYCLPDDPCFGVVEEQPNGVEGIHPKQNKRHILIFQPKVRGLNFIGSGGLDIVGAYPLDPMQQGLLNMVHELHNELVLPLHPEHSM